MGAPPQAINKFGKEEDQTRSSLYHRCSAMAARAGRNCTSAVRRPAAVSQNRGAQSPEERDAGACTPLPQSPRAPQRPGAAALPL